MDEFPTPVNEATTGVYPKFRVRRMDGSTKHDKCGFYVLDLKHDPFAIPALEAYAKACRATHPKLADDIELALNNPDPSEALSALLG